MFWGRDEVMIVVRKAELVKYLNELLDMDLSAWQFERIRKYELEEEDLQDEDADRGLQGAYQGGGNPEAAGDRVLQEGMKATSWPSRIHYLSQLFDEEKVQRRAFQ